MVKYLLLFMFLNIYMLYKKKAKIVSKLFFIIQSNHIKICGSNLRQRVKRVLFFLKSHVNNFASEIHIILSRHVLNHPMYHN